MDLQKSDDDLFSWVSCSICLESVVDRGKRSIAKLQCGHQFHLDCIGSAFNSKGAMQCPNCRKVEKGQWLYPNGYRSLAEFNVDELMNEDLYDPSYSDLPFGLQWCPFRGFTQLSSLFEEGELQQNAYHDLVGTAAFVDHLNASSSTHMCPHLALHGFPHATAPSSSAETIPDGGSFHRHPTGLGGPSSSDILNTRGFSATEMRYPNWHQNPVHFPVSGSAVNNAEQPISQLGSRLSRNDSNGQHRLGSFIHPLPFIHGSVTRTGSNLVASLVPPAIGDGRSHTQGHGTHVYQQSASSSIRSAPFAPVRRTRARRLSLISSVRASFSSENGGLYGFSVSGSVNRNPQDVESVVGRRLDPFYGWVREGFTPLPWIRVGGESQWWSPFHPNQNPHTGSADSMSRSYFPQRATAERSTQGRLESAYHQSIPRPHPFMR